MTNKNNKTNQNMAGQSVLELLVALGIFIISMTAGIYLFFGGQSLSIDSANVSLASDYAQEGVDAVRSIRDRSFSELIEGTHGLEWSGSEWMISSSSSDARDIFTRQIAIAKGVSDNIKIATTTITWQTDELRQQTLEFVEELADWETPSQSSCKSEQLSGNWANPYTVSTLDIGAGNEGTDLIAALPYIYMSGEASASAKPDIFVIDASNLSNPSMVASLDVGANGIHTLFLKGDYLYAASGNDNKELIIFDVSTPTNITEVGSLNLSGSADAISVYVFENTAVIGRLDTAANEIAFINVANPAGPTLIREDQSSGGDVNDFAATNDYLYVISKESATDILIYDIRSASNPILIGGYDIPPSETNDLSIYIHVKGGAPNLLVGNEEGELIEIGATTTSQMYVRSRFNLGGAVNDVVCVIGDLAFLATTNSGKEFTIVNVANPNNIVEYASLNYPQSATGIDFDNNHAFMSVRSNDALRIITSQ